MTGSQYKNVAQWTLANCGFLESGDSAAVAKAIFDNMGVAFPKGGYSDIMLTLLSEDYMGWCSCTFAQAQEFANAGTAAIGIDPARVVVILPDESADNVILPVEAPVTPYATDTAGITTQDRMSMQFFAYAKGTSSSEKPPVTPPVTQLMTNVEYYNNIHATPLQYPSGGQTFCNTWAHKVFDRCKIKYPEGGCTAELAQYVKGYDAWESCTFSESQKFANTGKAAIAITYDHMVVVTPNNIPPRTGSIPTDIGQVFISQCGSRCCYDDTLSWAWTSAVRDTIQFFYYNK